MYLREISRGTLVWQQKGTNKASALWTTRQQGLVLVVPALTSVVFSIQTFKFLYFYLHCLIRRGEKMVLVCKHSISTFCSWKGNSPFFSCENVTSFQKKRECSWVVQSNNWVAKMSVGNSFKIWIENCLPLAASSSLSFTQNLVIHGCQGR